VVGIFGHRQVGKTTLARALGGGYATLDLRESLEQANADPRGFLGMAKGGRGAKPFVIDECQLAPPLFPEIKEWVRAHPRPGQFLLTGSVRFSSRKAIRESLTGRIISWELLPMDLSEAHGKPLPQAIRRLMTAKSLEVDLPKQGYFNGASVGEYLQRGGLPGLFAVREASARAQRFETQIETLLERDLRLLTETSLPFRSLRRLLVELAMTQGSPLDWADVSRRARISAPTVRKLVEAFESMYLVRVVPTEGTRRKPVLFFEDQGEATHLAPH
jgi:predicted AAA+ superfamily ATPase